MLAKSDNEYEIISDGLSVARRLYHHGEFEQCIAYIQGLRIPKRSPHYVSATEIVRQAQIRVQCIDLINSGKAEDIMLVPEANKIVFVKGYEKPKQDKKNVSIDEMLEKMERLCKGTKL